MELLIDSCSYFRIVRSLHPLLGKPVGPSKYKVFIHSHFYKEYNKSSRLTDQFHWVNQPEFAANREKFCLNILSEREKEMMRAYTSINAYKRQSRSNISEVDIYALSTAYIQNITLITDDLDMIAAAEEFEISTIKTMKLLQYLHSNKIITDRKLLEIFDFWEHENDCPAGYKSDRSQYFPHLK